MAQILDGKLLSRKIRSQLKTKVDKVVKKPGLAVILVGNNPASQVYVNNKEKACKEIGYYSQKIVLPEKVTEEKLLEVVNNFNNDDKIHGILVQFPLPENLKYLEEKIIRTINPAKDVDGFHPLTVGEFTTAKNLDDKLLMPCTPYGVIRMLKEYNIGIEGKYAVVLGRSNLVGKPVSLMLLAESATVTICHSKTQNLQRICKQADILIAALGKPEFVNASYIKKGAVIIDVGINRTEKGLVGDVDFKEVEPLASYITPVPGGVGPMTIAMLMENVWKAYLNIESIN